MMKQHNGWIAFLFVCLLGSFGTVGLLQLATIKSSALGNDGISASILIPYTGHLTSEVVESIGEKKISFHFAIFATETNGTPLWSETQEDILLQDGLFQINLGENEPIPATLLPSNSYWLEVAIKGSDEAEYTLLSPRQRLSSAAPSTLDQPAATNNGMACPHDHFGEEWIGESSNEGLSVFNYSDGIGIHGYSYSHNGVFGDSSSSSAAGVRGENSISGVGVSGYSFSGLGVFGGSSLGDGVRGVSTNGVALSGDSSNGIAIQASGSGVISSTANSVLVLSPFTAVSRGSDNLTLTPQDNGAMLSHSTAGTEDKYLAIPVSNFGTLFGTPLYVKSLEVCYQMGSSLTTAYIEITGVYKNNNGAGYLTFLEDSVHRSSKTRTCYTLNATTPRKAIDNSTWVQLNIDSDGHEDWYIYIYTVKLTLSESSS
jgi:hypothetical protein